MAEDIGGSGREITEVWAWNFDVEFGELLAACSRCGQEAVLALDTEFPGFIREEPQSAGRSLRYQALRENVDNLRPIQLGVSVARQDGTPQGTWSFNLRFDVDQDLHTEASVNFLSAAGVDFQRLAVEGIEPSVIGRRLAASPLVGRHGCRPWWVTFQGWYDLGYLLKLLTSWPLPSDVNAFDLALAAFCPRRRELRDTLPRGSLDSLIRDRGVVRVGLPHTAGSDALATLELFMLVAGRRASDEKGLARQVPRRPTPAVRPFVRATDEVGEVAEASTNACHLDDSGTFGGTLHGGWGGTVGHLGPDKIAAYSHGAAEILIGQLAPLHVSEAYEEGVTAFPAAWDTGEAEMEVGYEDGYWNLQDDLYPDGYSYEASLLQSLPQEANSHFIGWSTAVNSAPGTGVPLSTYVATATTPTLTLPQVQQQAWGHLAPLRWPSEFAHHDSRAHTAGPFWGMSVEHMPDMMAAAMAG